MKKILFVIILLFAIVSCENNASQNAVEHLRYYKDNRTGICYASGTYYIGSKYGVTLTYVPCKHIPSNLIRNF